MTLALDCANYTAIPTPQQLDCLKQAGYARAIVGCSYGVVAGMQLAAFYAAGFEVEAYAWVSFKDNWQSAIDQCLAVINARSSIRRLWLDCEEQPPEGVRTAEVVARIKACIAYIASKRPDLTVGIYTAKWWWMKVGNPIDFADRLLWTAGYTPDGEPPTTEPLLYGGWQRAEMWQYAGSVETCGLNIDRNVIMEEHMPLNDDDKQAIANIVKLEIAAERDERTQDSVNAAKLALELFRQELEAAGQLPPRGGGK